MVASPVAAQRQPLGIYGRWGAFAEQAPRRCIAMAEPVAAPRAIDWKPFVAVTHEPARPAAGQIYFRLSRAKREGSAVLLKIDGRPFQLLAGTLDAWSPDRRADGEIVAAMRGGIEMVIETRSQRGAFIRERYLLRGAATAIDAAVLACAR